MEGDGATMTTALYVVATPLGNLGDISARGVDTLRRAAVIACEDTRHTRRLLDHFEIRAPLVAVHQHNEAAAAQKLLALLDAGQSVALVSDAGTPGICDPGARVVAAVRAAGHRVLPIPGANAAVAALSVAGLIEPHFLFCGFLPSKAAARRQAIVAVKEVQAALVFYEAPHRIVATIDDLAALLEPSRRLLIGRELTKLFEQTVELPLLEAPAWLAADENRRRGEFVLVVSAPPPVAALPAAALRVLELLLAELPLTRAVKLAVDITGVSRNALYERALAWRAERGDSSTL